MNNITTVFCLVHGENPSERPFPVEISQTSTIGKLKELIKTKLTPRLDHVVANELTLWKVNIPNDELASLDPFFDFKAVSDNKSLSPLVEIQDVFLTSPPSKHLHIIVQMPMTVTNHPVSLNPTVWYQVALPARHPAKLADFNGRDIDDLAKAIKADKPGDITCDRDRLVLRVVRPNSEAVDTLDDTLLGASGDFGKLIQRYKIGRLNPIKVLLPATTPTESSAVLQALGDVSNRVLRPSVSGGSDESEHETSFAPIQNKANELWLSWKPVFEKIVNSDFPLKTYSTRDHPRFEDINRAAIPSADNGVSPTFILHSLPDKADDLGYINPNTLTSLIETIKSKEWFMLIGTSGAGKTRSLYELFCRVYGIYLTLEAGNNKKNLGSSDLDVATKTLRLSLEEPENNSDRMLVRTRSVLAGRLFILEKLIQMPATKFTPKSWLLMQLLPKCVRSDIPDFWIDISKVFASSNKVDLQNYIRDTVKTIRSYTKQKLPIAIDEAQVATSMHIGMFYSSAMPPKPRSLFKILLQTVLGIIEHDDMCTILSGTGLRIDDMKDNSGSPIGKSMIIKRTNFVSISDGFDSMDDMKQFVEQFLGPLTDEQIAPVFDHLRGRRRFTVKFLERAIENFQNHIQKDMTGAIRDWRNMAVRDLVNDLVGSLDRIRKAPSLWPIIESAMIEYHVFSGEVIISNEEVAFAVEVGFARLNKINNGESGVIVVAGVSEPLSAMAYFKYTEDGENVDQKILDKMGITTADSSALGKLFERYLIYPLLDMFDDKRNNKTRLWNHELLSKCAAKYDWLVGILSSQITIYGRQGIDNYFCGKGDLLSYLEDPKELFHMPEDKVGPDIVFVISIHETGSSQPIRIPVFVQAKFAKQVDTKDAIQTVSPQKFYSDRRTLASYEEKRNKILHCLKTTYADAKKRGIASIGMLIVYPCKSLTPTRYDDKTQELLIVIDSTNAKHFFNHDALEKFKTLKTPASKRLPHDNGSSNGTQPKRIKRDLRPRR